jgi:hypothetical protein
MKVCFLFNIRTHTHAHPREGIIHTLSYTNAYIHTDTHIHPDSRNKYTHTHIYIKGAIFEPSTQTHLHKFRDILKKEGRLTTVRESKGGDEMGACGQLGDLSMKRGRKEEV